jgi:hypothetical protein
MPERADGGTGIALRDPRREMHMSRFNRKLRMLVAGALAISALVASPALAGKTSTSTAYKCWVTPNPVTNAAAYSVSGSGFPAGMIVNLFIRDKVSTFILYGGSYAGGTVGADGTFSIGGIGSAIYYPSNLGQKTVTVVNALDRRTTTLAQCAFIVQ